MCLYRQFLIVYLSVPESEDLDHFIEELEQFKIQTDTQPHSGAGAFSNIPQEGATAFSYVPGPPFIPQSTGNVKSYLVITSQDRTSPSCYSLLLHIITDKSQQIVTLNF